MEEMGREGARIAKDSDWEAVLQLWFDQVEKFVPRVDTVKH
jgi:hypothetical protein